MTKYNIAGINIHFFGDTNHYFQDRLADYQSFDNDAAAHIVVHCKIANQITPPIGKHIASVNGRIWLSMDNGGFASYDYCSPLKICLAKVVVDKDWKQIDVELLDLEKKLNYENTFSIYNMLGEVFRFALLKHNGIVIHSSSISYNGHGIIFSAPSETGKSTHTGLWKKCFPDETILLNDDTPAIRYVDGIPYVFGTPWSGSSEINCNANAPLKAIVFLEQSKENFVTELNGRQAIARLINEIRQPVAKELMIESLNMADKLLKSVPAYLLQCNISEEAVMLIKNKLSL